MEHKVEFDKHHQQCHIKNLIPTPTFPIIIFLCHLVRGIVILQHFCIQLIRHKIFIADTKVEPASVRELKEQKVRECIMLLYIFVVHVGRAAIVMHVISSPVWSLSATCTCMMHNYCIICIIACVCSVQWFKAQLWEQVSRYGHGKFNSFHKCLMDNILIHVFTYNFHSLFFLSPVIRHSLSWTKNIRKRWM